MKDFGDGTVMLRAALREAGLSDWLAVPWETTGGRVCVCDEPIPDDWTYFEVLFADVNFVAVSPVAGDREELRGKHLQAHPRAPGQEPTGLSYRRLGRAVFYLRGRHGRIFISFPNGFCKKSRQSFTYVHNRGIIPLAAAKRVASS